MAAGGVVPHPARASSCPRRCSRHHKAEEVEEEGGENIPTTAESDESTGFEPIIFTRRSRHNRITAIIIDGKCYKCIKILVLI